MSADVVQLTREILQNDLSPLINTVSQVGVYIGIFMVMMGIFRLLRHAHANMMYRISPAGTAMTFFVGTILISFTPELSVLSDSLFGVNQVFTVTCPGGNTGAHGTYMCPMIGYVHQLNNPLVGADVETHALKILAYAVLFFFGTISFLRGWLQLVKVSDGGGNASLGKALTHIIAGTIGVNAENVYNLFNNVLTSQFS